MDQEEIYKLDSVFHPILPATINFIERKSVNKQLMRALKMAGKQMVIYGHTGAGKTTLITKKLEENEINYVTTRCIKGMKLEDILIQAFNSLDKYYTDSIATEDNGKIGGEIGVEFKIFKASINTERGEISTSSSKRIVDLPISPQTLAKFMGESENMWLLEDFHKIERNDKVIMSQIMKVFMDEASNYPKTKIIAIGAVDSAKEVVELDPEMNNRVAEIFVPLMSNNNLSSIISEGCELLNIKFDKDTIDRIVSYSSGLPSVTHELSSLVCSEEEVYVTSETLKNIRIGTLDLAIEDYIENSSNSLKNEYEIATKIKDVSHENEESFQEILDAILYYNNKDGVNINDIKKVIANNRIKHYSSNLEDNLHTLTTSERKEVLRFDKKTGKYYFSNPFFRAHAKCVKKDNGQVLYTKAHFTKALKEDVLAHVSAAKKAFIEDFEEFDLSE